jgi:hypothetical protein
MGNAMACCGKSEPDPNDFKTLHHNDTKGSGVKISQIIKIQALMRGYLDRKKVKKITNNNGGVGGRQLMMHQNNYTGQANFDNPDVLVSILKAL